MKTRSVGLLLTLILLLAFSSEVVSAHANLVRSEPRANALLGQAPTAVSLWFDEPVELSFTDIQVIDGSHNRVDTGAEPSYQSDDHKAIQAQLKPLTDGSYTVIWKALSAADGHVTRGVFAFGVGNVSAAAITPTGPTANGLSETDPFSVAIHWLNFLAAIAFTGAFLYRLYLLDRGLRSLGISAPGLVHAWQALTTWAWALALATALIGLVFQASAVADVPLAQALALAPISETLFATHYGVLWIARTALVLLMGLFFLPVRRALAVSLPILAGAALAAVWIAGNPQDAANLFAGKINLQLTQDALGPQGWLHHLLLVVPLVVFVAVVAIQDTRVRDTIALALGAVVLATYSLGGHSSAVSGDLSTAVLADWLHLMGVAAWVGGLFHFSWSVFQASRAMTSENRARWIAWMVPQFSLLAITATAIIALTGLLNTLVQVQTLDLLVSTLYGQTLAAKVALFILMIGFGALNLLWLSPRFRATVTAPDRSGRLYSRFRLTVAAEVLLGAGALLLAGLLTLEPPARASLTAPAGPVARLTYLETVLPPDVHIELVIRPDINEPVDFDAHITNAKTRLPLDDIQRVIFQFTLLDRDLGATSVNAEARPDGHYTLTGNEMPLDGMWRIRVTVRRRGLDDVAADFPVQRGPVQTRPNDPAAVQLLAQSDAAMDALTSARARQVLNDGVNGALTTLYEWHTPNEMRFAIEGGTASIAIGPIQYYQEKDGSWSRRDRIEPFVFPDFTTARDATSVGMARSELLNGEPTQIVRYRILSAGGGDPTNFAVWLGPDHLVRQFAMVAPAHHMVQVYSDYNAPDIVIRAPENATVPTPAPVTSNVPASAPAAAPAPRQPGLLTGDLQGDIALGVLVAGILSGLLSGNKKWERSRRFAAFGIAVGLIGVSFYLFVDSLNAQAAAQNSAPINPVAASAGQRIYEANCLACHGPEGRGDGPAARTLSTQPFDLTVHIPQHDELYALSVITNGRGAMPAFKDKLTQDEIYQVIAYARLLAFRASGITPASGTPAPGLSLTPRPGFTPGGARPGFTPGVPVVTPTP